jgi:hypothetical protein
MNATVLYQGESRTGQRDFGVFTHAEFDPSLLSPCQNLTNNRKGNTVKVLIDRLCAKVSTVGVAVALLAPVGAFADSVQYLQPYPLPYFHSLSDLCHVQSLDATTRNWQGVCTYYSGCCGYHFVVEWDPTGKAVSAFECDDVQNGQHPPCPALSYGPLQYFDVGGYKLPFYVQAQNAGVTAAIGALQHNSALLRP